jgi:hypothetical protein
VPISRQDDKAYIVTAQILDGRAVPSIAIRHDCG